MARVVVVGGGVAGLYFAYRLLRYVEAEVVLVDQRPSHVFTPAIAIALAGLMPFEGLEVPFSRLSRVKFVWAPVGSVRDRCALDGGGRQVACGDYLVLAPGAVKVGGTPFWTVDGARSLYQAASRASAIRFVVSGSMPPIGFAEVAYALRLKFPRKEMSIHLLHLGADIKVHLAPAVVPWFQRAGIALSEEPPAPGRGDLLVYVPDQIPHPLAAGLEVDPATFETQLERVYLIGDSSLLKLGIQPMGWGALWQAATLARAVAGEVSGGVFEVEADDWVRIQDKDAFYRWFAQRMANYTPLAHVRGAYERWMDVVAFLEGRGGTR